MESKITNEVAVIPGPPVGWVDMLDIAMDKKAREEAAKPSARNPLRPSSAGRCAREKAYDYAEYKGYMQSAREPLTPESQRIFSLGHAVEKDILWHFKGIEGLQVKYQQQVLTFYPLHDGTLIEGSIDAVFVHPKWKTIIDIKSKKDKFSNYYSTNWDETSEKLKGMKSVTTVTDTTFWIEDLEAFLEELNDAFFASNFLQLNMYAVHPFIRERGIDCAAIIQVSKNDCRLREIRFKPSDKVYERVRSSDQNIAKVVDDTKDPTNVDKTFNLGSISCAFCSRRSVCWPEDNATKAFYQSLPDKKRWPKDTDRLGDKGEELDALVTEYEGIKSTEARAQVIEQKVLTILQNLGIYKIRLKNGNIYESKRLKHSIELRRSKL